MPRKQIKSMALGIGAVNAITASNTALAGAIVQALIKYGKEGKEPAQGEISDSLWAVLKAEADEMNRISELRRKVRQGK